MSLLLLLSRKELVPPPVSDWTFNESSGNIIDQKGVGDISFNDTTPTYNGDNVQTELNGNAAYWTTPNGTYGQASSFTIVGWFQMSATSNNPELLSIGAAGSDAGTAHPFRVRLEPTLLEVRVYNGSSWTVLSSAHTPDTAKKYFMAFRYTRTGGAADNILSIKLRSDGDWISASTSSAGLMVQSASNELTCGRPSWGPNYKMYRLQVYDQVLTDDQLTTLYNLGSEG